MTSVAILCISKSKSPLACSLSQHVSRNIQFPATSTFTSDYLQSWCFRLKLKSFVAQNQFSIIVLFFGKIVQVPWILLGRNPSAPPTNLLIWSCWMWVYKVTQEEKFWGNSGLNYLTVSVHGEGVTSWLGPFKWGLHCHCGHGLHINNLGSSWLILIFTITNASCFAAS